MDLSENVAKNLEKMVGVNGLWTSRVSWVLEEEIRNQPIDVRFLTLGPKSDRQIKWFRDGSRWVGSWFGQP